MLKSRLRNRESAPNDLRRKGAIIVLAAATMVVIMAFAAFSLDVGWITLTKAQMQNAVDAGALAAAMELNPNIDQDEVEINAKAAAEEVAALHRAGDHGSVQVAGNLGSIEFGRRTYDPSSGQYNFAWGTDARPYNLVKVTAERKIIEENGVVSEDHRLPLFFAPVIGHDASALKTTAVASFQPRDIMLVLDYSASMNDDSELRSMYSLGQQQVEDQIEQMWEDLGSPTYGNMGFVPDWVTIPGTTHDMDVTWRTDEVDITANGSMQYVKLYYSNGYSQTFSTSQSSGTWKGTGGNNNKRITKVKVKKNGDWETIDFYNDSHIRRGLGLDNVTYPYASGSWNDYINYARNHSSSMSWYDGNVFHAGYRRKFGMLTFINHLNKNKPRAEQTAGLWQASQQPITALKNATDLLMDYLLEVEAEDQVGLSVYTYPPGDGGKLELPLGASYNSIKTVSRQRQAGHYDNYTNIGAGMRTARLEIEANARPKAFRMMILMTDGLANRSSTAASPAQFVLDEADLAADSNIRIMTISLGAGADSNLMQQVADRTGGQHFNVPGGQTIAQYEQQLKNVFGEIAADRPLKLVAEE